MPFPKPANKVFEAVVFAAKAHASQYRKSTKIPYLVHPLGVATLLIGYGCSDDLVVAGLLHDVIEDTPVKASEIQKHFGKTVVDLVKAASEPDKSAPWEQRKTHTIEFLKTAPTEVLIISCADKLNNIQSILKDLEKQGENAWSRFNRPKEKQKWYYQSLAKVFISRLEKQDTRTNIFVEFVSVVEKVFGNLEHS